MNYRRRVICVSPFYVANNPFILDEKNINLIVAGCLRNERQAQETLYRSFYGAMMNLCMRYTKNEQDALEVLNTGFLKVFRSLASFDINKASLSTWIRKIIVNSCIDYCRLKSSTVQNIRESVEDDGSALPHVFSTLAAKDILDMLRLLPPATQTVFNLFGIEGFTHKEIAGMLGISEGTSKWHYSEARKKMQKLMNESVSNK